MPKHATGSVVVRDGKQGRVYALRFRAYGERRYVTLGTAEDGWTERGAYTELENILADVRRGIWQPPMADVVEAPKIEPTFHEFASEWYARHVGEWRERTREDYQWALSNHLLPFFKAHRLSQITVEQVDRYRAAKVREREEKLVKRPLGNVSINKTLTRLSQILEDAVEYGYLDRNPAKGKRRRLKSDARPHAWLEADEVPVLIESAGKQSRALVATLIHAGLRVGEACDLRWGDVDLPQGLIHVRDSKTAAGVRDVHIRPELRPLLVEHRQANPGTPAAYVFTTRNGTPQTRQNIRRRVLLPAVKIANAYLERQDRSALNPRLTPHSLRKTFASLLFDANEPVPYVMAQLGHTDPALTLTVYAHALSGARREEHNGTAAPLVLPAGSSARLS